MSRSWVFIAGAFALLSAAYLLTADRSQGIAVKESNNHDDGSTMTLNKRDLRLQTNLPNLKTEYNHDMEAIQVLQQTSQTLNLHTSESPEGKLVIGVLTDPNSLQDIDMAVFTTWVRDVESKDINVIFFIGSCEADTQGFPARLVCLNTPDVYPPQRKVFLLWKYFNDNLATRYQWFMKIDHDAFVNAARMRQLIAQLTISQFARRPAYIGLQAVGRPSERAKLGLSGKKYCSGLGYIVNKPVMEVLGSNSQQCLSRVASDHSDTEIGRCIFDALPDTECESVPNMEFRQVYYQQDGDKVMPMKLVKNGQMKLEFFEQPKGPHFAAVVTHPLKRAEDFYRFHKQMSSGLRPLQPAISSQGSDPNSIKQAAADLHTTCVNNPVQQQERYNLKLPECASPRAQTPAVMPNPAYVLSTAGERDEGYQEIKAVLSDHGIDAIHVHVDAELDTPEHTSAYNKAMQGIFRNATLHGTKRLLILEENTLLRCDFRAHFWQLLNSPRCGGHLYTDNQGGVLLLGADSVSPSTLEKLEADRSRAFSSTNRDMRSAMCYNAPAQLQGSFAGVYHRATFSTILAWLGQNAIATPVASFDQVYPHLAQLGYIVRAAFPNAVLRETVQGDVSNEQLAVHLRWSEGNFCRRGGQQHNPMFHGSR
eukprot:TRINITY_DN3011_c0_g1_i1.p1 TRINITY_DN3011_c0_g1~~TRINITY_DN3011_c0_g1_i1.p1  ORF type:complete len:650 (+),score=143.96 TRINITY_DN3011_c0_g1_i1:180-2129(+)